MKNNNLNTLTTKLLMAANENFKPHLHRFPDAVKLNQQLELSNTWITNAEHTEFNNFMPGFLIFFAKAKPEALHSIVTSSAVIWEKELQLVSLIAKELDTPDGFTNYFANSILARFTTGLNKPNSKLINWLRKYNPLTESIVLSLMDIGDVDERNKIVLAFYVIAEYICSNENKYPEIMALLDSDEPQKCDFRSLGGFENIMTEVYADTKVATNIAYKVLTSTFIKEVRSQEEK